jgi:hypothetical protein
MASEIGNCTTEGLHRWALDELVFSGWRFRQMAELLGQGSGGRRQRWEENVESQAVRKREVSSFVLMNCATCSRITVSPCSATKIGVVP